MRFPMHVLGLLALLFAAAPWGVPVHAAGVSDEIRYDLFRDEDGRHRFDRLTGDVEKLEKTPDGIMWVKIPVIVSKKAPTSTVRNIQEPKQPSGDMAHLDEDVKKKQAAPIVITDDNDNELPEVVTDADRKNALADIASYENMLATSITVKSDDRITGIITVKNKGERKLRMLEVTMQVPVGRDKPEEHRFLFLDKAGSLARTPQPMIGGKDSLALLQKVDVPGPAGGVKGSPELKITYIKFADK